MADFTADFMESLGRFLRSPALKFFLILFLVLLLGVPLLFTALLINEREIRARMVESDIAKVWGGPQDISGPVLAVPYTVKTETLTNQGARIEQVQERLAFFLPETLVITGKTHAETRHRSIFDINVYTAELELEGRFAAVPNLAEVEASPAEVRWNDAVFSLGISAVTGFKEVAALSIETAGGRKELPFAPSSGLAGDTRGIHVRLGGSVALPSAAGPGGGDAGSRNAPLGPFSFRTRIALSGTGALSFAPAARETSVSLTADWPHPSFSGAFLPVEHSVRKDGFSASWRVPHLARAVPNTWRSSAESRNDPLTPYLFGVSFLNPVEFYDLVSRATKYALLFITSAFLAVFVLELLARRRLHAVQYLLIGIAMVFFYVLLLSLAEHTGFLAAYLAAAGATGLMLSLYIGTALASWAQGAVMLAVFTAIYGLLYLILQLEDYALLAGALLGFAGLTLVMFLSVRVNWPGEPAGHALRRP